MEEEQLKVCAETPGWNFQNILCIKSTWHRLMMLEGLAKAGDGHEGFGERAETAVSLLAWDQSLEASSSPPGSQDDKGCNAASLKGWLHAQFNVITAHKYVQQFNVSVSIDNNQICGICEPCRCHTIQRAHRWI